MTLFLEDKILNILFLHSDKLLLNKWIYMYFQLAYQLYLPIINNYTSPVVFVFVFPWLVLYDMAINVTNINVIGIRNMKLGLFITVCKL